MNSKIKKDKKLILKKKADKSFKRKLHSRKKKKEIKKLRQGLSKEDKKQIQEQKGYKVIKSPTTFSLTENTEQSLEFIRQLEDCFKNRKKVWVDLRDAKKIAHGAVVVLLSKLVKFKSNKIDFNGYFPKDEEAKSNFKKSGFFKCLSATNVLEEQNEYSFENEIYTYANKNVIPLHFSEIISKVSQYLWNEERQCTGLQRVFIELTLNTHNHASVDEKGTCHWWLSVFYSPEKDKVCFSFIDYGEGILKTLKKKEINQKFYGVVEKLKSRSNIFEITNAEILEYLLSGKIHQTLNYNRGNGLPSILKVLKSKKISNLKIITNNVMADCEKNKFKELKNELSGTFIYWEIHSKNYIKR